MMYRYAVMPSFLMLLKPKQLKKSEEGKKVDGTEASSAACKQLVGEVSCLCCLLRSCEGSGKEGCLKLVVAQKRQNRPITGDTNLFRSVYSWWFEITWSLLSYIINSRYYRKTR